MDDATLLNSAKACGIRLARNDAGELLAPLNVIAHAAGITEVELMTRLTAAGARFVSCPDMGAHEIH